jgi:hypothetical protein
MMVIFVSQCEKNALKKTRRILDSFAILKDPRTSLRFQKVMNYY